MARATNKEIAAALRRHDGLVAAAARSIGIHRSTIHKRMKKHPTLADVRRDAEDRLKDDAESELAKAIRAGEPWAVKYFLDRRCRDRGYGDSSEHRVVGDAGGAVSVVHRVIVTDPRGDLSDEGITSDPHTTADDTPGAGDG